MDQTIVSGMDQTKDYGLLFFDIPATNMKLYFQVRTIVDKTCLPVNQSVYVFEWGLKNILENKLVNVNAFVQASVHMVKFDPSSSMDLENMASNQLIKIFEAIRARLESDKYKLLDSEKKKVYIKRSRNKLDQYSSLAVLYQIAGKILPALDLLNNALKIESAAL